MTTGPASRGILLATAGALVVSLTACSGGGTPSGSAASSPASPSVARTSSPSSATVASAAGGQPFGSGCAQLPATGPGSVAAMGAVPVGVAAASSPELSTLVTAVQRASLGDTLNSTPDITVLAPADPAFTAVPGDALTALLNDTPRLTAVLTHHVIPGRLTPAQLAGRHTTVANDTVTVVGSGAGFTISGDQTLSGHPATVLCGGIQTANATVYVIDQVLKPAKGG